MAASQNPNSGRVDLAITRLIRLGGLITALHAEFFIHGDKTQDFGIAAIMMAGSLGADVVLKRIKTGNGTV